MSTAQKIQIPTQDFILSLTEKKTPLEMNFVSSGMKNSDLPPSCTPEFAIVGRSNVGKSSFINFLSGQKNLARVSHTPGRTQTINLFSAEKNQFMFVDLPGYGFASSPHYVRAHWQDSMAEYFSKREGLCAVLFLVDIRRDVQKEDFDLSYWLQGIGIRVIGVQTKCDKVHKSQWAKIRQSQALGLALSPEQMITISSSHKIGLLEVNRTIAGVIDSLNE